MIPAKGYSVVKASHQAQLDVSGRPLSQAQEAAEQLNQQTIDPKSEVAAAEAWKGFGCS